MRVLIAYSSSQDGPQDPTVLAVAAAFKAREHEAVAVAVDGVASSGAFELAYDVVLIWNALPWYLSNRLRIRGRPWVAAASWCFDDLHCLTLGVVGIADLGLDVIFSSSRGFAEQIAGRLPIILADRPGSTAATTAAVRPLPFGVVVPNVADRDFCLAHRAKSLIEARASSRSSLVIYVSGRRQQRLPVTIADNEEAWPGEEQAYAAINTIISTPRVTDLASMTPPVEILKAVSYGCRVLAMQHPCLDRFEGLLGPFHRSLRSFDAAVEDLLKAPKPLTGMPRRIAEFMPSPGMFAEAVLQKREEQLAKIDA